MKRIAFPAVVWFLACGLFAAPMFAAVAIDPNSPSILYFARYRGYFMRSDDDGQTWAVKNAGLPPTDVQSILAVGSPTVLYAATGSGLYRSRNHGDSWTPASEGLGGAAVIRVAASPASPANIYATTAGGVFRSTDEGESWIFSGLPGAETVAVDPMNPSIVYAGVSNALYRSTDFGRTWTKTGAVLPILTSAGIGSIAIDPKDPRTLLIAESATFLDLGHKILYTNYYLFVSHDRGDTASQVSTPLDAVYNVVFDPDAVAYIAGTQSVASSVDGGAHWVQHPDVPAFALAASPRTPRVLVEGFDQFDRVLSLSDGGGAWTRLPLSPCLGLREELCFVGERFRVSITAYSGGQEIQGIVFPMTADAGAFWLFSPNNLEVVVKIVDGRPINGAYWFFAGTLTDVGYRLVVDDRSGSGLQFVQYPGEMRSFADLEHLRGEVH
jgi:photosystem II stability/assembly factor-like uncharacterized protein